MATFDWKTWAKNFPLTVEHVPAEGGLPESIKFDRAGQTIYVSMEELDQIMAESLKAVN